MKVKILFFGATADVMGEREIAHITQPGMPSRAVFEELLDIHPKLRNHKLLFSVNQEYSSGNEILKDGDELAIFTAVSGG